MPTVEVGIYCNSAFSAQQMQQIRYGLLQGIDVRIYASQDYSVEQMRELRLGMEDGVDMLGVANPTLCRLWCIGRNISYFFLHSTTPSTISL